MGGFTSSMGGFKGVQVPGGGSEGYHVLKVQQNSPGYCAGLEPFFDFIIAICDTRLSKENDTLQDALERNMDKPTKLMLYSTRTLDVRETVIVPSSMWGGPGLLGISIRFSNFQGARENVWHVLEVEANSPAALAGLRAYTDYIIGAETFMDKNENLFKLINSHEGRLLKFYIYNTDTVECREVYVRPNCNWGGAGSLGCGIGYGYLHRVPTTPSTKDKIRFPTPDENFSEVCLTAVIPTIPVCISTVLEQTNTAFDLTSVRTDAPVSTTDPVTSPQCVQTSVDPAATQEVHPSKQSFTVSASTLPSSEHSLPTSCANAAVTQDEASPSTVVQMIGSLSQTPSSVISSDSINTVSADSSLHIQTV
ncbi:Golgi reassembly-stacking protein 2-like isoform X1 [Phyllopteryx taeniolatus]|uniref:Golgi reassembly-stacking protein 2-like isoform X1 n=2 Tax=Phyllopteryx taeniolatus TaxID=161469 RepID=UPI002AD23583|nr:Golgi reassembly-stacking protein 2-like isoform X1 [Phyllopteryx taeniolatus]